MRKIVVLLLILIISGCDYGCDCVSDFDSADTPTDTTSYSKTLFMSETPDEFIEYLYSNPIDAEMKKAEEESKIYRTKDIYEFYMNYHTIWENEMNIVYGNLMDLLDDEAKTLLENSQVAWEEESINNSHLWRVVFDMSKGRGSMDTILILNQKIDMIRLRTFSLAEYHYWIADYFEFA